MGILIFFGLFIASLFFQKSKILSCLIIVFMIILYGLNTYSGDYIAYESVYNSGSAQLVLTHYEPLFSALMALCIAIGLGFTGFRIVLSLLFVILLYNGLKQYTDNTAMALGLFMIFPFPYFMSVLRAGIACMVFLYVSRYLCKEIDKSNTKFIIGVIIATLFHYSSIIFLFAFVAGKRFKKPIVVSIFVGSGLLAYIVYYTDLLKRTIAFFSSREKTLFWAMTDTSKVGLNAKGIIAVTTVVLIGFLLMKKVNSIYHKGYYETIRLQRWEAEFAYNLNYLSVLILPLIILNPTWLRLIWEIQAFFILSYSNLGELKNKKISKTTFPIIQLLCIGWVVVLLLFTNLTYMGTENSVWFMFRNNILFQLFY